MLLRIWTFRPLERGLSSFFTGIESELTQQDANGHVVIHWSIKALALVASVLVQEVPKHVPLYRGLSTFLRGISSQRCKWSCCDSWIDKGSCQRLAKKGIKLKKLSRPWFEQETLRFLHSTVERSAAELTGVLLSIKTAAPLSVTRYTYSIL